MSFEGYQEALESQKQKESEVKRLQEKYEHEMKTMREEMEGKFQQILARIDVQKISL
ncbi:MAG: hypothetical protein WCF23_21865 [Candidatus Nitrosopolaris sp.]